MLTTVGGTAGEGKLSGTTTPALEIVASRTRADSHDRKF